MKKLSLFLILTLFGITAVAEGAQSKGAAELTAAPQLSIKATGNDYVFKGTQYNARLAIAPYAQVVPNSSYTFIGVTHPSLSTAHTSIGLVIEAMNMAHPTQQAGNGITVEMQRAVAFTIDAGTTHRVFIVNEGHAVINSLNASINNKNTHIITTKSDESQFGNIRVTAVGTEPNNKTSDEHRTGGVYKPSNIATITTGIGVHRFDNLNQLSMWGVVYQESNGAGFSLEFIGDMHDSSASGVSAWTGGNGTGYNEHHHKQSGIAFGTKRSGAGRGIN